MIGTFSKQQRGAVTIEFAFMLLLLCLLIAFMADLFIARSTIGKLDRTSYSVLNVVKERGIAGVPNAQGNVPDCPSARDQEGLNLGVLANYLLFNRISNKAAVVVECVAFQDPPRNHTNARQAVVNNAASSVLTFGANARACIPQMPLTQIAPNITPLSEMRRYVPVIRVTVCIPGATSMFLALSSAIEGKNANGARTNALYSSSSTGVVRLSEFRPQ